MRQPRRRFGEHEDHDHLDDDGDEDAERPEVRAGEETDNGRRQQVAHQHGLSKREAYRLLEAQKKRPVE